MAKGLDFFVPLGLLDGGADHDHPTVGARHAALDEDEVVLDMSGGDDDDEAPGKMPAGFSEDGVDSDEEDDDSDDIDLDEEFDLGDDIELDDDNELGEPDADDIEPEGDDK